MILLLLACTGDPAPPTTTIDSPTDSEPTGETGHTGETAHTGESGDDSDPKVVDSALVDTGELWAGTPRIVLFIGDGMGFEHVAGGGLLANGAAGTLGFEAMPHIGNIQTASITGTTDSAASATAMATGVKTENGFLGLDQARQEVKSVVELARELGLSVGVVTTDKVVGATPSAFLVHNDNRGDAPGIASDILATPPDVLFGGGGGTLEPMIEGRTDLQVVRTHDELTALVPDGRPVLGVFAPGELEYQLSLPDDSTEPSLAAMTSSAYDLVKDDPDGFLLVVEGARIDHASHGQMPEHVHHETVAFADAIQVVLDQVDDEAVVIVTADHECGGLHLTGETTETGAPGTQYFGGSHTNDDVGVWAQGPRTQWLHDERRQNVWIHTVIESAMTGEPLVEPVIPKLVDGWPEEIGSVITTQTVTTSLADNQLDTLRVDSDGAGLRVGIEGVFGEGTTPILLIDIDLGDGTGLGSDNTLGDTTGRLDEALSAVELDIQVDGLGFELAVGGLDARSVDAIAMDEQAGLRGVGDPWVNPNDLYWLFATTAFDYGNITRLGVGPSDAGATGATEGGWEILIPWSLLYPDGMPTDGLDIGLVAVLTDSTGTDRSNQVLPPLATTDIPGSGPIPITSVVRLEVDNLGTVTTAPALYP